MAVPKKKRSKKYYYNKLFLKVKKASLHKPLTTYTMNNNANLLLEFSNDLVSTPIIVCN